MPFNNLGIFTFLPLSVPSNRTKRRDSLQIEFQDADSAVPARHHPHRKHDLLSGSQDYQPSENSVPETVCCNSTSNAPDDGRM